jgi:hypothetical protein
LRKWEREENIRAETTVKMNSTIKRMRPTDLGVRMSNNSGEPSGRVGYGKQTSGGLYLLRKWLMGKLDACPFVELLEAEKLKQKVSSEKDWRRKIEYFCIPFRGLFEEMVEMRSRRELKL